MSDAIEHHKPIAYAEDDFGVRAEFVVTPAADGRSFKVSGACPACAITSDVIWEFGNPGYKGLTVSDIEAEPVLASVRGTVICDCGRSHAGRSNDAVFRGCGASWKVELP